MRLVESHLVTESSMRYKSLDNLCFLSKNLYNSSLYHIKNHYSTAGVYLNYYDLDRKFKTSNQENYRALPIQVSQQTMRILDKNHISYFKLIKKFKKKTDSLSGMPKPPMFKHSKTGRFITILTKNTFKIRDGIITFSPKLKLNPLKTKITETINQIRIIPLNKSYKIEIVYEVSEIPLKFNDNKASIDLGVNNLATITTNTDIDNYILNGKPIKSDNHYYNKILAKIKSDLEIKNKSKKSKKLNRLYLKHNNKSDDYLHKSSKKILDILIEKDISELAIGYNTGWKSDINLGSKTNQNFCAIAHKKFIDMIIYKCKLKGIKVMLNEESYTSKCSALDKETLGFKNNYLGKRAKRGMFISADGTVINADVNGSLNIGRKVFGDDYVNNYLTNKGYGQYPIKINV